jgi:hypothetical protein
MGHKRHGAWTRGVSIRRLLHTVPVGFDGEPVRSSGPTTLRQGRAAWSAPATPNDSTGRAAGVTPECTALDVLLTPATDGGAVTAHLTFDLDSTSTDSCRGRAVAGDGHSPEICSVPAGLVAHDGYVAENIRGADDQRRFPWPPRTPRRR